MREYRLLTGGKGVNLGLTQRLIIGKDRGKRQRGSNPLPSTKKFFDIVEHDKTGDGGGVFQPPQTGATMVAMMVRVLLPVSEDTSIPDVEERTKEMRMATARHVAMFNNRT